MGVNQGIVGQAILALILIVVDDRERAYLKQLRGAFHTVMNSLCF